MSRYPTDPNGLLREVRDVNSGAANLREEGWTVTLKVNVDGQLIASLVKENAVGPPELEDDR